MKPLIRLVSRAAPLMRENIDTDAIIPSREMRSVSKTGLADGLFAGWRYLEADSRQPDPDFVLNKPAFQNVKILVGGDNFGCGSSREHAVWALAEYGFRVIIAPSFAPIFRSNCIRNGVAPIQLQQASVDELAILAGQGREFQISIEDLVVSVDEQSWNFSLDPEARTMLLEALDLIELTLRSSLKITDFRKRHAKMNPWLYLDS